MDEEDELDEEDDMEDDSTVMESKKNVNQTKRCRYRKSKICL